ncbi:hypothetical protein [Microbacterium sp. NPDC086615]|uniref:hypothetical protein n=1 Tax=Microbacterium sp. NPDC086615 TaxID=3154865 RepID=UPI003448E0EE
MYDQLIAAFTLDNIPLLIAAGLTFAFGYWEYLYSFRLLTREKKAPFPIWMHTFYLAHDSSWAVILLSAAAAHNWNWFLTVASIALFVWTGFEIFNLWKAVTLERVEIWGPYFGDRVTIRQAVLNLLVQLAGFYAVVNLLIVFMGEGSVLQWFALTNVVMAAGPGVLWARRGSRDGTSVGLGIVIVFGTINTFLPTGMFVLALPEVFNTPWFYLTGVVFTFIAIGNLVRLLRYPRKQRIDTQRRPIW